MSKIEPLYRGCSLDDLCVLARKWLTPTVLGGSYVQVLMKDSSPEKPLYFPNRNLFTMLHYGVSEEVEEKKGENGWRT